MIPITEDINLSSRRLENVTKEYRYEPLASDRSVRLLRLLPAADDGVLRCEIAQYQIENVPKYRALSYAWGESSKSKPHHLLCGESYILAGDNLASALRCFGRERRAKHIPLWVDAVCINQEDSDEKEKQIPLMNMIYRRADEVVVWLGHDPGIRVNHFVSRLDWVCKSILSSIELVHLAAWSTRAEAKSLDAIGSKWTRYWVDLFGQTWFLRLWVLQEASLASRLIVYYEGQRFRWHYLGYVARFLAEYHDGNPTTSVLDRAAHTARNINTWRYYMPSERSSLVESLLEWGLWDGLRHAYRKRRLPSLIETLYESRFSLCTNEKDRIFGILAFAESDGQVPIPIDYKLSIGEDLIALAEHLILKDRALDLLVYVEHPKQVQNLPSWVPDWSFKSNHNTNWRRIGVTGRMFKQRNPDIRIDFRKYKQVASLKDDRSLLVVSGRILTTIDSIGEPYNDDDPVLEKSDQEQLIQLSRKAKQERLKGALISWYQLMLNHPKVGPFTRYVDGHMHFAGALRLAHVYNLSETKLRRRFEQEWTLHNPWKLIQKYKMTIPLGSEALSKPRDSIDFRTKGSAWWTSRRDSVVDLVKRIRNMRFCITVDGTLVLCPHGTRAGDNVALIRGVRVPFVLRFISDNRYFVVGSCYVHLRIYNDAAWSNFENDSTLNRFELG